MTPAAPIDPQMSTPAELQERIGADREGVPYVVYRDGDGVQRIVRLDPTRTALALGRHPAAEVALPWDEQVSGTHALLERVGGEWTLVDDGLSRNGSFVNGERVRGRRRLRDGDTIRLGETLLIVRAPSAPIDETVQAASGRTAQVTEAQRRVLLALCRPFREPGRFARPPTNQQIADELVLSVEAVKTHMRELFKRFDVEDLPQNQKRLRLVELALLSGVVSMGDLGD